MHVNIEKYVAIHYSLSSSHQSTTGVDASLVFAVLLNSVLLHVLALLSKALVCWCDSKRY